MYKIIILLFIYYAAVNGEKWPKDLGPISNRVNVGESVPSRDGFMSEDRYDSLRVQQQLNTLANSNTIAAFGLDPIRRREINFDLPLTVTSHIKLTKFVATGVKYLNFEQTAVYRDYNDNSFRIDLIASTPILGTKSHFLARYNTFWSNELSGRSNVFFEHVRLQISAILRSEQRDAIEIYQVKGLDLNVDVDNIRMTITTKDYLPMSPEALMEDSKGKFVEMVAEAIVVEVNSLLEHLPVDQVLQQH